MDKNNEQTQSNEGRSPDVGTSALLGDVWVTGKVFRCHSERFGTHDFLCVKCPGSDREERLRALEVLPDGAPRDLLFFSSVAKDRVEKQWPNLSAYYAEVFA